VLHPPVGIADGRVANRSGQDAVCRYPGDHHDLILQSFRIKGLGESDIQDEIAMVADDRTGVFGGHAQRHPSPERQRSFLEPERTDLPGQLVGFDFAAAGSDPVTVLLGSVNFRKLATAYLVQYFWRPLAQQPLVMLLEDMQWADEAGKGWRTMNTLAESARRHHNEDGDRYRTGIRNPVYSG
jgi:hypothetical protein